jgi:hypothetical protein
MKCLLKFVACSLIIGVFFFTSCKKENYASPVVIAPPGEKTDSTSLSTSPKDLLTGHEFIFNELVWAYDVDGGGNLYMGVENRPELFSKNDRSVEVSVKPDSSNTWTIIEKFLYPNSSEFVYSIYSNSLFVFHNPHIFSWSADTHLAGKVFSVKVKLF